MCRFLFLVLISIGFMACEKDEPITFPTEFNNGLFFVNEGQFNNANASLSYYDVENDSIFSKAYEMVNNQSIGDILQSVAFDSDNIYLVVNNSGKIIVADKKTLVQKGEIKGLPSPRYMEYSGNGDLWYVSNLFNTVEAMKTVNGKLFLSSLSSDRLMIKDLNTNSLDSLVVGQAGGSLAVDNDSNLWLLCSGDYNLPGSGALYKINTNTLDVSQHVLEPEINIATGYPSKLVYNNDNNTLYFLNTDVYALNLQETNPEPKKLIEASSQSFYGINIINNSIFVTDAIDYTQNGLVYEYNTNGELMKTLTAGIIPNAVISIP